jgi:hypothetical protein
MGALEYLRRFYESGTAEGRNPPRLRFGIVVVGAGAVFLTYVLLGFAGLLPDRDPSEINILASVIGFLTLISIVRRERGPWGLGAVLVGISAGALVAFFFVSGHVYGWLLHFLMPD